MSETKQATFCEASTSMDMERVRDQANETTKREREVILTEHIKVNREG